MKNKNELMSSTSLMLLAFSMAFTMGCDQEVTIPGTSITLNKQNIETLIIRPYTETCQGFIEQQCYLEFNEESQEWEFFYESIQGFDFEPGYIYTLKVRLEDRGTEIQDVGRYAYHLVEVLSKEEASVDERPPRKP